MALRRREVREVRDRSPSVSDLTDHREHDDSSETNSKDRRERSRSPSRSGVETEEVVVQEKVIVMKKRRHTMRASSPAHWKNKESPLSSDAIFRQSHAGLFNLCIVVLIAVNSRLIIENLMKYGILINSGFWFSSKSARDWPLLMCGLTLPIFPLSALLVEKLKMKMDVSEGVIFVLHLIISTLGILYPGYVIHRVQSALLPGLILILIALTGWMKLVSYAHVNKDVRELLKAKQTGEGYCTTAAKRGRIEGTLRSGELGSLHDPKNWVVKVPVDPPLNPGTKQRLTAPQLIKLLELCIQGLGAKQPEVPQEDAENVQYPDNLTVQNIAYFMLAPTLCYQLSYPRSDPVRKGWVLRQVGKLIVFVGLMGFIVEQYINPTVLNSQHPLKGNYLKGVERILKLSIPVLYVWLCIFYCLFHLWLNIVAELLRFGDREFYKDWWNAETVEEYWRMWNMPVHRWMVRHIYFPSIRAGLPKIVAMVVVFVISALFHEVAIGVPCHMLRCWAFLGIMMQLPLVYLTNVIKARYHNSMVGNMVFWFFFCIVGQPMLLLLYYHDVVNNVPSK